MKISSIASAVLASMALVACTDKQAVEENLRLQSTVDSLAAVVKNYTGEIAILRDSISILKYPASDRLAAAKSHFAADRFDEAEQELDALGKVFPNSVESRQIPSLRDEIYAGKARIRKEQERIEALGFKAIAQKTTVTVDYNKIVITSPSIGDSFTFDSYDDHYHYLKADRGNKYVTMSMSMTSTDKNPQMPAFAVYKIVGGKMVFDSNFIVKYARWEDYGTYLGNYTDYSNSFAKVSTVRFKLGAEISADVAQESFAIVMINKNVLSENYDRWNNPPQYWSTYGNFPSVLTVSSFDNQFTLIKTYNLK